MKNKKNEKGVSVLIVVVIIAAVSLIISRNISFIGFGELEMGDRHNFGEKNLQIAEACLEEVLLRIRENHNYAANEENITFDNLQCRLSVSDQGGEKIIDLESVSDKYKRQLSIQARIIDDQVVVESYKIGEN